MRDLHSNISVVKMLTPIVGNNDTEGTPGASLDLLGFGSALLIAMIGVSGDTLSGALKIDVVLEDGDDGDAFVPVTDPRSVLGATPDGSGIIATIDDAAKDDVVVRCGYVGGKRYVRLRLDFTGTHTNGCPVAMLGLRGRPAQFPVA